MAKRLIVNADDYNTDPERNRGIIEAVRRGIVTSTTVIANTPWQDASTAGLKSAFEDSIGVHLNLTKGVPIVQGLSTLVNDGGQFFDKGAVWRKALLGLFSLREIETEFAAQITLLRERGIVPDHIDGNNHVHVFPGIAGVVAGLARDFGIPCARLPHERFARPGEYVRRGVAKKTLIGHLSQYARRVFETHGIHFPERFAGIQFPEIARVDELRAFVASLPDGVTELMCHPGYRSPSDNPFSSPAREEELASLTDPSVKDALRRANVTLISFQELA
jgi:predicted glycoside hydrolase/deacetylase ChbG (UPF0249 family)